jgi:Raf kinase inhibitor-like YbhB/YbcL family protein
MKTASLILVASLLSGICQADMSLTSSDIQAGKTMGKALEYRGFDCNGGNHSPALHWQGAPAGTESFAITAYDPDAPTGRGWWHWLVIDIPKSVNTLPTDAGAPQSGQLPAGALQLKNDFGAAAFGGPCPPAGDNAHRYQFTVYALGVKKLAVPAGASAGAAGDFIRDHALGSARLEALYRR